MGRMFLLLGFLAALVSSCTPAAPVPNPTQIENTAVAQANNFLTPVETEVHATRTPVSGLPLQKLAVGATAPSANSPLPLVFPVPAPPVAANTPTTRCDQPLPLSAFSVTLRVGVENSSQGSLALVLWLDAPNALGECGYLAWHNILPGQSVDILIPQSRQGAGEACYRVDVEIDSSSGSSNIEARGFCIDSPRHWIIRVGDTRLDLLAR